MNTISFSSAFRSFSFCFMADELDHPEVKVCCLYADGIAQVKTILHHTHQILQETLEKVQRVLPLISL